MIIETKYFSKTWFFTLDNDEKAALILSVITMFIFTLVICSFRTILGG